MSYALTKETSITSWFAKAGAGGIGSLRQSAVLQKLETEAREARKGLWQDPAPVPPWIYRKARRGQALDLLDLKPVSKLKNDVPPTAVQDRI